MASEAGHHSSRCYIGQDGAFYLNGAAFYNDNGDDVSAALESLDQISTGELEFLDGVTAGTVTASKAVVVDASKDIAEVNILGVAEIDSDRLVTVANTAAGGSGGATAGTFSLQVNRYDESTAVGRAVQVLVEVFDVQYSPLHGDRNANVTFNTASTGTLVASGNGWALVETDATGAFACATANGSDETVYFRTRTAPAHSDPTDGVLVMGSDSVSAVWAA